MNNIINFVIFNKLIVLGSNTAPVITLKQGTVHLLVGYTGCFFRY
jgi:hypothetical protein